ncbi:BTB/POZ domain-containing protein 17-like isoform X3 [Apostichopus japonicus]
MMPAAGVPGGVIAAVGGANEPPPLPAVFVNSSSQLQPPITVSGNQEDDDDSVSSNGKDCFGNERQALRDLERFFNNTLMSDIRLKVDFETFHAHKLVLVRSSEVFERMFSSDWTDPAKQEIELVEEPECTDIFPAFLRYLYSCHIKLTLENTLPVLMLADKYNVVDLRQVCIGFATQNIIPKLPLKDVFHIWYQYATKCYHQKLIRACIIALSPKADDIISQQEWSQEWIALDKHQLIQFLKSSDLAVRNELTLFRALLKWIESPKYPERSKDMEKLLGELIEFIRFPVMTAEQLEHLERLRVVEQYHSIFVPHLLEAYKYNALTLESRAACKDSCTPRYMVRNYTDLRWDKRIVLSDYSKFVKFTEVMPRFSTRSSSYPHTSWDWEVKIYPKGSSSNNEDFRVVLYSNVVLDQPRAVEYMVSIVNNEEVLTTVTGKKNFTKSRYFTDTDIDKKVTVDKLMAENSPYLVDDNLHIQVRIKPIL